MLPRLPTVVLNPQVESEVVLNSTSRNPGRNPGLEIISRRNGNHPGAGILGSLCERCYRRTTALKLFKTFTPFQCRGAAFLDSGLRIALKLSSRELMADLR